MKKYICDNQIVYLMNIRVFAVLSVFVILNLTSCISNKQRVYMQNKDNALAESMLLEKKQPPYRVQVNDVLSIRVKALDQALVGNV